MASGNFVAYYRVSTEKQGRSGLGLDAQREAVRLYLNGGKWNLVGEFIEIESGKRSDRPQLAAALALCRVTNATLIVAKLDRLSRNARFLLSTVEGTGDAGVVFCDLPHIPPGALGKFFVTQMASIAELEAGLISKRTKDALAAAKARGTKLGGKPESLKNRDIGSRKGIETNQAKAAERAIDLRPRIEEIRAAGCTSLRQIAAALNDRGIVAPRGSRWAPTQVKFLLERLDQANVQTGV
jgi:DNA invertase Pin-like site-specific DNA recombinase